MKASPDTAKRRPAPPVASQPWRTRRVALAAGCIFVFAVLLYLPALRNDFVWDDGALIADPGIRTLNWHTVERLFTSHYWETLEVSSGLYRPLTILSMYLDYQLYELNPAGFHLTNLLLNATVCALIFFVLLELFARPQLAFVSAMCFTAFPMHVENVAWISGRTDVIATLMMLASLWCYARWLNRGQLLLLPGVLVFYAAALLGKEVAVVLPAVIAVVEILPRRNARATPLRGMGWLVIALLLLITVAYLAVRKHVLGSTLFFYPRFTTGLVDGVAFTLSLLAHYTYKLVFPFLLDVDADFKPTTTFWNLDTMVGLAVVVTAGFLLYRLRHNGPFLFALGAIAFGIAPVLNILPLGHVMAERFLYFPSIGFVLLIALAAGPAIQRRNVAVTTTVCAFVLLCSARTVAGTLDWKDELTLFRKAVAISGDNARAHANLGHSLYLKGQYEEAVAEYTRATELNPLYSEAWTGLASACGKLGRVKEALGYLQRSIELKPTDAGSFNALGILQFQDRDYEGAAASFRRVLELRPRHTHARFNLGLALYRMGNFDGAVRELSMVENKDTDFANAYVFMAEAELRRGNTDAAARAASHFLSLHAADDRLASRAREIVEQNQK